MPSKALFKSCTGCQEMIPASSRRCPKCDAKQKTGNAWKWVLGVVLVLFGLQLLGENETEEDAPVVGVEDRASQAQVTSASSFMGVTYPASQAGFVEAVVTHRETFRQARNEVVESASRDGRAVSLSKVVPERQVVGWVGTVAALETNTEGKGILSVEVADDVFITTWNNALSDMGSGTLIDKSSAVYRTMMDLQHGDRVSFSGKFMPSRLDHLEETSLTIHGSMTEPEYLFRFASLQAIN